MHAFLRALAFVSAGALVATFVVAARLASGLDGIPFPFQAMSALGGAGIVAWISARARANSLARLAWMEAALCVATTASPWLLFRGPSAWFASVILIAGLTGAALAAFAQSADSRRAGARMWLWAAIGAALSVALTVLAGIPWLGIRGTLFAAAGVHALAAVVAWRVSRVPVFPCDERPSLSGSLRTALVCAAAVIASVAWARTFAATLVPTPFVYASCAIAPLATLAIGLSVGLRLAKTSRARRLAGPLLLAAAIALALPVVPLTVPGAITVAFGGANWPWYAWGVLRDAAFALGPAFLLLGAALPLLPRAGTPMVLAGGAIGGGVVLTIVPLLGAVPGATAVSSALLLLLALATAPRRASLLAAGTVACLAANVSSLERGDLPVRAHVLQGMPIALHWERDAFHSTVHQRDGVISQGVDSIVVEGNGRAWHAARGVAHLAALLAPGARSALLLGPGTEESKKALSSHPGLVVKEAAEERPALLAAACKGERFDVIVHRPPIDALWGGGGEYTAEAYAAARDALLEKGIYAQEVVLRTTPPSDLKRILASFIEAFPEGTAWFFRESLLLVGARGVLHVELASLVDGLSVPAVYQDLLTIDVCRPWDFLEGYLCDASVLRARLEGVEPLRDDAPADFLPADPRYAFAYIDDLEWLLEGRQGVTPHVVAGKTRGERWLVARRLARMRKAAQFSLTAQLKYAKSSRARDQKEEGSWTNEAMNAAGEALKIDPGDRYAWETLTAVSRLVGQAPTEQAPAPFEMPTSPPAPELWRFQPDPREEDLMRMLDRLDTERGGMRLEALNTLEEQPDASVAPLVAELAEDPDPLFRAAVAGTLEKMANPAAAPALARLLHDPFWNVRRCAAEALGKAGLREQVPALLEALVDKDASVREAAYVSIHSILKVPIPRFDPRDGDAARARQVESLRRWWDAVRLGKWGSSAQEGPR